MSDWRILLVGKRKLDKFLSQQITFNLLKAYPYDFYHFLAEQLLNMFWRVM